MPFYPPKNPENQNFENMKIMPGDINILYMYTINDNHVMYGSWDMEHNGQNFLSFWTAFCPFTPLKTQKIKIFKKWKKPWRYHHFTQVHQKSWLYATLFLRYNAWLMSFLFFILGYFLPFYNSKNQNWKKKKKNTWRYHPHFIHVYQTKNYDHVPKIWCAADRWQHLK